MKRPDPACLGAALAAAAAAGRPLGRLAGPDDAVGFADLLRASSLGGADLGDRSVLIATRAQFAAAVALIELDGRARRIVLCPPDLDPAHLPAIAGRAGIDAVVTDGDPAAFQGLGVSDVVGCGPLGPAAPAAPSRPTEWVLLTSGTTGVPKMVAHSLAGLTGAIRPPAPDAPSPVWSTFYDIRRYGGLQILLRAVLAGGTMVLSDKDEPVSGFLARLGRHGATHVSGTPSHWRRALMSPAEHAFDPGYVRLSGEIADQAVLDALQDAFPRASVGHAYASTEAGVGFEVTDGQEGFPARFLAEAPGGVELRVVEGSLRIRSPRTATTYVGEGAPVLMDADGFVDTGDMVALRGERYHFVGRRGGIINVGGLKVHPEEVEAVINRHPRVRMALVEGRRNPITGSLVTATVVLEPGEAPPAAVKAEILAACREALAPHKVPAILTFADALAVTQAGKLARPGAARHA